MGHGRLSGALAPLDPRCIVPKRNPASATAVHQTASRLGALASLKRLPGSIGTPCPQANQYALVAFCQDFSIWAFFMWTIAVIISSPRHVSDADLIAVESCLPHLTKMYIEAKAPFTGRVVCRIGEQ